VPSSQIEAITRRIQQAIDIAELVRPHVRLVRAGKDWKGLCPFHSEQTPSFYVAPSKQIFKCFGCGAGGDVFKFIQLREKVSFPEARAILAAKAGISLEADRRASNSPAGPDRVTLARANEWAATWFRAQMAGPAGGRACEYAAGRGLTRESIESFGLGFAPDGWESLCQAARAARIPEALLVAAGLARPRTDGGLYDVFRNRLMFPIRDVMQRVIGFGGRALGDDPAKYLNTPQTALFEKTRCLFGLDRAKSALDEQNPAIVVEGYLDCVMAHQHGFSQAVATLGTALGPAHVEILRRYTDSVVLLFDGDEAGARAADRALRTFLEQRVEVRLANLPEGLDPCAFLVAHGADAFREVLNSALDALELHWRRLAEQYRTTSGTNGGRRRAVQEFLSLVAAAIESSAVDAIQRGLLVNQIARLLGVGSDDVRRQLVANRASAREQTVETGIERRPVEAAVEAVATRELLEVLLNEPGYWSSVASQFDPEVLADEVLRSVGRLAVEALNGPDEFSLDGFLARIESVEAARRVTDLYVAGQRKGNFGATVEGAVARLQQGRLRCAADSLRDALRSPTAADAASDQAARASCASARQHRHFAARRHLRRTSLAGAGD